MTKAELVKNVAMQEAWYTQPDIDRIVNAVFTEIADALASGEKYTQPGFGTFVPVDRAARLNHNPSTGEAIQSEAYVDVKFRVAKQLKETLNEK